jgi:hypothetical protein
VEFSFGEVEEKLPHVTDMVFLHGVLQLLVTSNIVPSSLILVILIMEVLHFCETSVLTRYTRCNMPEDSIVHGHRCENLKSYIALTGWAL